MRGPMHMQYIEQTYLELDELSHAGEHKTTLCRNKVNGNIVVKKQVLPEQVPIYRQLKKVDSPHLIPILDICNTDDECLIIMEYVSGRTIAEILSEKKRFEAKDAMAIFEQLMDALQMIHIHHIIHRDIKPENLLVSSDGVVKLLDFGIARIPKKFQNNDTTILGTAGYASPEQFGFQQTGVPADIYAAGVVLNKLFTGKLPSEELAADRAIRLVIQKCIHIDPQMRYKSIERLREDLGMPGNYKFDKSMIPGYRSGKLWKIILASIVYPCVGVALLGIIGAAVESDTAFDFYDNIFSVISILLIYFILTNFNRWDRKLFFLRKLSSHAGLAIRIFLSVAVLYFYSLCFVG